MDRLTRKLADFARLASHFERHRVSLNIVYGNIDADAGSLAGLQVNMLAAFAEWERDIIRERIAEMRGAIRTPGERSAGRVPLGYRTDPDTKQLVIEAKLAAVVRWFFEQAAKGTTTNDLVTRANKKKLAGRKWSSRSVLRLLTNQTYAGRRPDGAPGRHTPIVSAEPFFKVQALIDGRRTREPTKASERDADEQKVIEQFNPFVLRGLITCGTCEKTMSPSMSEAMTLKLVKRLLKKPNAVPRFYRCRTAGCAGQVPALVAEEMVRDALDHAPENWSAADKAKLAEYRAAYDVMWPVNRRRVFGACSEAVVWNRKRDGLDIKLIPQSALEEDNEPTGALTP